MAIQAKRLRAVLLDRGGTLMVEFPGMGGPMAEEPRVEAIPGAEETLRVLHGKYTLVVATNGRPWDTPLVLTALAQVNLDRYFDLVITARDLGVAKPDPAFFHAVLDRLAVAPGEAAMVGDGYGPDIVGAKSAGLRAIWFNPAGVRCPLVHPVHDAEIRTMAELPAALDGPLLPDLGESLHILRDHAVPANIVRHSLAVAAVAHWFAVRLRERGERVNPLLVHRGGLLHDLDKVSTEKPADHGVKAGRILRNQGWPDLAVIAEVHVLAAHPRTWEEKLVHYADKIVDEDRVVRLTKRLSALAHRYPAQGDQVSQALPSLVALEEEILGKLCAPRETIMAELQTLDPRLPSFVTDVDPAYDSDR